MWIYLYVYMCIYIYSDLYIYIKVYSNHADPSRLPISDIEENNIIFVEEILIVFFYANKGLCV